jgi:hypothetical protein
VDVTDQPAPILPRDIASLRELIEARLDGYDKAIVVLQEIANSQPTPGLVMAAVDKLEAVNAEKFAGITTQFKERDTRTDQSAAATKIAVDAALQAAKEAVAAQNTASAQAIAKSEAATTKQIDAIANLITAQTKATDEKVDDVKGRLLAIEGQKIGEKETRTDSRQGNRDSFAYVAGAVGMLFGFVGAAIGIAGFLAK